MPNNNSKDLLILQKLNKESRLVVNKQHTLLLYVKRTLGVVLLIMLFYAAMILTALFTCSAW